MIDLVRSNDIEGVREILKRGEGRNPQAALNVAISRENYDMIDLLLEESEADIRYIPQSTRRTMAPLWVALEGRVSPEMITFLVEKGADPSGPYPQGSTPLVMAAKEVEGDTEKGEAKSLLKKAQLLLEHGADPDIKSYLMAGERGWTALMIVAKKGFTDMVKLLLEWGADPNVQGKNGMTALMLATQKAYYDIIKILLEYGADRNILYTPDVDPDEDPVVLIPLLIAHNYIDYHFRRERPKILRLLEQYC